MSNPVTNVEVEDVLSSIRRLVSDDKRPSSAAEMAPSNDRLVLTPALRVTEQAAGPAEDEVSARASSDVSAEPEQQAWSDFNAGFDHDETPNDQGPLAVDGTSAELSADLDQKADFSNVQGDSDDTPDESSEDVAAQVDEEVKLEPLILEMPKVDAPETPQIEEELDESAEDVDVPVAELVQEQSEAAFFAKSSASLSAKIAALETVIGKTEEQWEPDDTGKSDYSGTEAPAMKWDTEDTLADDEPAPQLEEQNSDASAGESVFGQAADDILDEDALRDLVSDIVREELQGALGERITRNVRKLVRREIHRALAAQDLE